MFQSVLCAAGNTASGVAALRQAAWLAADRGAVDHIPPGVLDMEAPDELLCRCAGHDLLVVEGDADVRALVRRLPIPVLFARWCAAGAAVTDAILVAVDAGGGAARAAELAGELARRHRGSVSLTAMTGEVRERRRALSTAGRIVLQATGSVPEIVCDVPPAWVEIPRAAAATGATLVIVGAGDLGRESALDIARHTGCSVLIAPAPQAAEPQPVSAARAHRHALPV